MHLLTKIWDDLDSSLQQNQHLLLSVLEAKLQKAVSLLNSVVNNEQTATSLSDILKTKGRVKKGRFALSVKDILDQTMVEFSEWHYLFDPSWYLIARVTSGEVDRHFQVKSTDDKSPVYGLKTLRKSIRDLNALSSRPVREISPYDFLGPRSPISESQAAIAQFHDRNGYVVIDSMVANLFADEIATVRDVMALCKALSRMDPYVFGLLRCCGVINKSRSVWPDDRTVKKQLVYDLAFEVPTSLSKPTSLRDLLKYH